MFKRRPTVARLVELLLNSIRCRLGPNNDVAGRVVAFNDFYTSSGICTCSNWRGKNDCGRPSTPRVTLSCTVRATVPLWDLELQSFNSNTLDSTCAAPRCADRVLNYEDTSNNEV